MITGTRGHSRRYSLSMVRMPLLCPPSMTDPVWCVDLVDRTSSAVQAFRKTPHVHQMGIRGAVHCSCCDRASGETQGTGDVKPYQHESEPLFYSREDIIHPSTACRCPEQARGGCPATYHH
jgi:hypothetical protein